MSLLIGWHLVLRSSQHLSFCANSTFFSIEKMNKCIRMGITASNLSFGEVNRRFYSRKLRFMAPLTRRRKTKFPTVKLPIYLPKCQIWKQLSPKWKPTPACITMQSSTHNSDLHELSSLIYWGKIITVFDLITVHTPISAQSRNSVVFRLQPMYFFFTSL